MGFVLRLMFFVVVMGVGAASVFATTYESIKILDLEIRAPQVSEEARAKFLCYQLASAGTEAGEVTGEELLKFLPEFINFNVPPIYQVSKYSSGLTCYVLKNIGANDFSWSLGASQRLDGCKCSGDLEVVK